MSVFRSELDVSFVFPCAFQGRSFLRFKQHPLEDVGTPLKIKGWNLKITQSIGNHQISIHLKLVVWSSRLL